MMLLHRKQFYQYLYDQLLKCDGSVYTCKQPNWHAVCFMFIGFLKS